MACEDDCHGCQNTCSKQLGDIESYQLEASKLQKRVQELEARLASKSADDTPDPPLPSANGKPLRSRLWFDRSEDLGMRALYTERYLNYGLTQEELLSGKPIIGIAQSGSDLSPCNRHHVTLEKRVREGIRSAGGIAIEFPTHPIQESARRPTAALDRNLAYLGLVELLHAYPFDGVVLLTGCDKTTPACLMAAATVNIPAICLNVGPMLNGWSRGQRIGSGSVIWKARELHAAGKIDEDQLMDMVTAGTPSPGHCNTMGTAGTMNALAEALGMALPGSAAIPAPYRQRSQMAYKTGERIVALVHEDCKPCDIMTRQAFENAIVANTAIGGSTNAPIHLNAIAKHAGVPLNMDDWDRIGYEIPLLLNMQPAGEMLSEDYYHAGGLPAILAELLSADALPHPDALTVSGQSIRVHAHDRHSWDRRTITPFKAPLKPHAGFQHLSGSLCTSALIKTSVISPAFRAAFLPDGATSFTLPVAVFDGPEDYKRRLDDAATPIDAHTILVMRGTGPRGYPGGAEVVNMHAPARLLRSEDGLPGLPCLGDGRQSGTSGSPSILHVTPEAAEGGTIALLKDGDVVRVDLERRRIDVLVEPEELARRRKELDASGGYPVHESQTPWQDIFRRETGPLNEGMVLRGAVGFQRVAQKAPAPKDNH
ncbi:dihydroxy-acid dehydratase [Xylariomycetidae sp. FL0641]|nr:dihydroxy-acid dehydratase [Xylariomycetidae sp. FL0641]